MEWRRESRYTEGLSRRAAGKDEEDENDEAEEMGGSNVGGDGGDDGGGDDGDDEDGDDDGDSTEETHGDLTEGYNNLHFSDNRFRLGRRKCDGTSKENVGQIFRGLHLWHHVRVK